MSKIGMNVDGWKVVQMRNDIKYIKKNIKGSNVAIWSILIDACFVLLTFALNHIFDTTGATSKIIWGVAACLCVIIPLSLFIFQFARNKRAEKVSLHVSSAKELVKTFDDEVCYAIMSAESFNNNLKEIKEVDSRKEALLIEFYFIEAGYYLNKAVDFILRMDNNFKSVIAKDDNYHIARERIINAIGLIAFMYEELSRFFEKQSATLQEYSVYLKMDRETGRYHSLKEFTTDKKQLLRINDTDIETIFNKSIPQNSGRHDELQ